MKTSVDADVFALEGQQPCPVQISVSRTAPGIIKILNNLKAIDRAVIFLLDLDQQIEGIQCKASIS